MRQNRSIVRRLQGSIGCSRSPPGNKYTRQIPKLPTQTPTYHRIKTNTNTRRYAVTSAVAVLNPKRAQWHFDDICLFLATRHSAACFNEMAPFSGSDADHFKDKARRDLLTLLEGVSRAPQIWKLTLTTRSGPGEEEPRHKSGAGWSSGAIRQVLRAPRLWSPSSVLSGECKH